MLRAFIGVFSLLISTQAFAFCEAELNSYLVAANAQKGMRDAELSHHESQMRKAEIDGTFDTRAFGHGSKNIAESIQDLKKELPNYYRDPLLGGMLKIKHTEYKICMLSNYGLRTKSGGNQGDSVSQPQQSQQQSQQSNQPQQLAQEAQQQSRQNQQRADQARQGKRKTHDPAAEAHQCVSIDKSVALFGAFKNTCGSKVNFVTCNYRPRTINGGFNWSADFDCDKQQFGMHNPDSGQSVQAHNHNTEMVYWFACKAPALPVDTEFVRGQGVLGRCY